MCREGTFFGLLLYTPVDTSVSRELRTALAAYSGPKVKVNSLRRHFNVKSDHYHGNAADLELAHELVEWLVSEQGQS